MNGTVIKVIQQKPSCDINVAPFFSVLLLLLLITDFFSGVNFSTLRKKGQKFNQALFFLLWVDRRKGILERNEKTTEENFLT
jgi:hypothetical protein